MKIKAHVRVGRDKYGKHKVAVNVNPSRLPLTKSDGTELPTVAFAVEFDIPDSEFKRAEQVIAEIRIPATEVCAEVRQIPDPAQEGSSNG